MSAYEFGLKAEYSIPQLTWYGRVKDLTGGATGSCEDGGANARQNCSGGGPCDNSEDPGEFDPCT